jgi:putative FmdB family regulatory protein
MPLYSYQCEACAIERDEIQKSFESPAPTCEVCGQPMKRVMAESHFRLRGTGWTGSIYSRYRKET